MKDITLAIALGLGTFSLAQISTLADVYLPPVEAVKIVPEPQEISYSSQNYTLSADTAINLSQSLAGARAVENLAQTLKEELIQNWQIDIKMQSESSLSSNQIRICLLDEQAGLILNDLGIKPISEPEGYVLHVDSAGVIVVGSDERGVFYGLQSLRQLLRAGPELKGLTIRDYPDLPLRVAMIYLDSNSDELNAKLLPLLAAHKFNTILVMSNYIRWDSAPELHLPGSASKEMVRNLVEISKVNLLNPIPLLETLGHTQWMFSNDQHRDLLADPTVAEAFAYDPLNPDVYKLLLPIIDEAVELFEPKMLHIGHDEVRNVVPFPGNEAQREVGFAKLFLDDTLMLYNHLAKQGIKTMMWHDVLLSDEITPILSEFPKDITVASWNYEPAASYPDLEHLQTEGFQALGATWFKLDNITSYAQFAKENHASGMIQTRWTGYFGNNNLLTSQYNQAYAYLSAANVFWNASAPSLENAPLYFRDMWLRPSPMLLSAGKVVDLNPYTNRTLDALESEELSLGWLGRGKDYDMSALLKEERIAGFRFLFNQVILLKGSHRRVNSEPESVVIPLNTKASSLAFLHTTGWAADIGNEVGSYSIHFADGSSNTIPLHYGRNISAWTENEVFSIELNKAWKGKTRNNLDISADLLIWNNPKANQNILSLEFHSTGGIANPILLGLSVIE